MCKKFAPNWPASSPYVTAVGGIYYQGNTVIADTIASGGFSDIFGQPSYQYLFMEGVVKGGNKRDLFRSSEISFL